MAKVAKKKASGTDVANGALKIVYHDEPSLTDYQFCFGAVQPGSQPSFFLKVECPVTDRMVGLHLPHVEGDSFDFINFDWALAKKAGGSTRVTCYLKFDLQLEEGQRRWIVLVDESGAHRRVAIAQMRNGHCSIEPFNPVMCTSTNFLREQGLSYTPLFVGGAPKSGTTWMEMLLNSHPSCIITGENSFWDWPFNSYNLSALPMPAEERYIRRASVVQKPYSNAIGMMGFGRAEITFRQLAALTGASHVGDKSPGNALHAQQILLLFPHGHYIHCYRHPLDVAVSRAYHEVLILINAKDRLVSSQVYSILPSNVVSAIIEGNDNKETLVAETLSDKDYLGNVFDGWLSFNHYAALAKREYPGRVHFVSYESLSAMPEGTIMELYRQVGLEHSPDIVAEVVARCDFNKVSGGRDRGASDNSSFFRKGVVGDFPNHFNRTTLGWAKGYLMKRDPYFTTGYF
ncbi:sulfotransferase [Sphingobium sp. DEHP117]|uniref:sulfotransferase family protein n=1 Tax=Sphingobium sp. DEHP117 TaxID=2993436 RepID=UPI0027D48C4B|nr:sulfotransferase [Sphingobium sp. DEHP117]MDQ4418962.1 sulfotransferase [Sphingobium sp. DEHP117]